MGDDQRKTEISDFEDDAEVLFVQHLDLLAQLEAQLRAVHHQMRSIERLRGGSRRVGPELSNGERESILAELTQEVGEVDPHVSLDHECCRSMHMTSAYMRARVATLKQLARRLYTSEPSASDDRGSSG